MAKTLLAASLRALKRRVQIVGTKMLHLTVEQARGFYMKRRQAVR
ncbi:hypothetical protein KCP78_12350 [Salmonella enterica subsp. enterica]|nr:hypothetical protein KCP78_12350 [Salmonella enterica subsp. enterica]